jgi:hypothetical protein
MQPGWRLPFACSIALLASCASSPPKEAVELSIRSVLPGRWDWAEASPRCGESAAQFAFSEASSELRVHVPTGVYLDRTLLGPDATYRIVGESPRVMRMHMLGETRRTETGDLVVWDLVLLDADSFCWHRTDWPPEACTKRLTRCEASRAGS